MDVTSVVDEAVVEGTVVDGEGERVERIVERVEGASVASAESNESLTNPGSCCNLASIDGSEEVSVSWVDSTNSPTVLRTKRLRDSGASALAPSPTLRLELMGSHWLSGSECVPRTTLALFKVWRRIDSGRINWSLGGT